MRILALDVGDRRIGVAISDDLCLIAHPWKVIERKSLKEDISHLRRIVEDEKTQEMIVGMPLNMDGTSGRQAEKVKGFVTHLKSEFSLPIKIWDERLTTVAAERPLREAGLSGRKRRKVIDKLAACFILQNYLDSRKADII